MRVVLAATWFVEGVRYRRGNPPSQPVEIPDHLRGQLPPTARVLADDEVVEAPLARAPNTLNEMGRARHGGPTMAEHLRRNMPKKPEPVLEDPEPEAPLQGFEEPISFVVDGPDPEPDLADEMGDPEGEDDRCPKCESKDIHRG